MSIYSVAMLAGSIAIFALYGWRCAAAQRIPALRQKAWLTALLAMVFSAVFGVVLARVSYALLMQELDFEYDGLAALEQLLWLDIDTMCFFGGAVGVCLGVLLANRITRKGNVVLGMDAFAPFAALLVALFRLGEGAFGSYGTGTSLPEGSPLAFFPFALEIKVDGGYSYWGWAIFALSAAFALVWASVAFFGLRSRGRAGLSFTLTMFFLALPQVLCESMRKRGMLWLFVHVEQLLYAIVLVGVLVYWIISTKGKYSLLSRWAPLAITLVCIGLLVATEFAIDGKLFDLSHTVCYTFMTAVLLVVGACGLVAAKRWNAEK
ncbi:MAG: hypothetical protein J6M20_06415 [Clostridia bacterium]|nr:hypothetical protein [Clostridia bacterium]